MIRFRRAADCERCYIQDQEEHNKFLISLAEIPIEIPKHKVITDEDFQNAFVSSPDVKQAVAELFERAIKKSQERVYLAVIDVSREYMMGKAHITNDHTRFWIINQFNQFLGFVDQDPKVHDESTATFLRWNQILAYSQLWECVEIQRLIWSLIKIAKGKKYNPRLILDSNQKTGNTWTSIIREACSAGFAVGKVLDALYYNVVRNHFVHSDFLIEHGMISNAPNIGGEKEGFVMKYETWDMLFNLFKEFIKHLYQRRNEVRDLLEKKGSFKITLPEFGSTLVIHQDRGRWIATPAELVN